MDFITGIELPVDGGRAIRGGLRGFSVVLGQLAKQASWETSPL